MIPIFKNNIPLKHNRKNTWLRMNVDKREDEHFVGMVVSSQRNWKNESDQTYSCLRDRRFSASWGNP